MAEVRIGIIGYGKIAQDQHVPAISADPRFRLSAVVSPNGGPPAPAPVFASHEAMLAAGVVDAVAICTPAAPRHAIARDCLSAGVDALLEKPPTATLGELLDLKSLADLTRRVLFTTWHAQYNPAVTQLQALLAKEGLQSMQIEWIEDVDKWHPGQQWIWDAGGFGVFDPGINALSIASQIAPARLLVRDADFLLHSAGQQPIAATVNFHAAGVCGPMNARFDWRCTGDERWNILGHTAKGTPFLLSKGGAALSVRSEDVVQPDAKASEYPAIYARFAELLAVRQSIVDGEPLRLVADAALIAHRASA